MRTASPSTSALQRRTRRPSSESAAPLVQLREVEVLILEHVRQLVRDRDAVLDVERRAAHEDVLLRSGRSTRACPTTATCRTPCSRSTLPPMKPSDAEHGLLALAPRARSAALTLPSPPSSLLEVLRREILDRDRDARSRARAGARPRPRSARPARSQRLGNHDRVGARGDEHRCPPATASTAANTTIASDRPGDGRSGAARRRRSPRRRRRTFAVSSTRRWRS